MKEGRGGRKEEEDTREDPKEEPEAEEREEEEGSGREERPETRRGSKREVGERADEAESRALLPGTRNWSTPELAKGLGG